MQAAASHGNTSPICSKKYILKSFNPSQETDCNQQCRTQTSRGERKKLTQEASSSANSRMKCSSQFSTNLTNAITKKLRTHHTWQENRFECGNGQTDGCTIFPELVGGGCSIPSCRLSCGGLLRLRVIQIVGLGLLRLRIVRHVRVRLSPSCHSTGGRWAGLSFGLVHTSSGLPGCHLGHLAVVWPFLSSSLPFKAWALD
jgi:hypothetical protein